MRTGPGTASNRGDTNDYSLSRGTDLRRRADGGRPRGARCRRANRPGGAGRGVRRLRRRGGRLHRRHRDCRGSSIATCTSSSGASRTRCRPSRRWTRRTRWCARSRTPGAPCGAGRLRSATAEGASTRSSRVRNACNEGRFPGPTIPCRGEDDLHDRGARQSHGPGRGRRGRGREGGPRAGSTPAPISSRSWRRAG